jgi:Phospholipase_D-nuclease N-terminal
MVAVTVLSLLVIPTIVWIWGCIDCCRRDSRAFAATGRSKPMWCAAVIVVGVFGALGYLIVVRRSVRRAELSARERETTRRTSMRVDGTRDDMADEEAWSAFMATDPRAADRDGGW